MPRRRDPAIRLHPFGEELDKIIKANNLIPSLVAKASELGSSVLSKMRVNVEARLNRENVLKCIEGLARLHAIISVRKANDLLYLARLDNDKFEAGKLDRRNPREKLVIELINNMAQERQEALDRPRYYTSRTEFIGHEEDIDKLIAILNDPHSRIRLLNLVGLPGVGKTELAEQIIARGSIQEHFDVTPIFLRNESTGITEVLETIIDRILQNSTNKKRILVVLHDCEVIGDTPNAQAELKAFLKAQKRLTVLATRRRPFYLGSKLEYIHEVSTLRVPRYEDLHTLSFKDLQAYEAIELFRQAAKRNDKEFTLTEQNIKPVAAICQALDGLPLALLIAATLVRHEPIDRIYKWIEENGLLNALFKTDVQWQQSLNLLIDKSYNLLADEEQRLFRRLAVFISACDIEAVEAICNVDDDIATDPPSLSSYLATLHDNYLITYENGRIEIAHNTPRVFAHHRLWEKDDELMNVLIQFIDYYHKRPPNEATIIYEIILDDQLSSSERNIRRIAATNYEIREAYMDYIRDRYIYDRLIEIMGEEAFLEGLELANKYHDSFNAEPDKSSLTDEEWAIYHDTNYYDHLELALRRFDPINAYRNKIRESLKKNPLLDQFNDTWMKVVEEDSNIPYKDYLPKGSSGRPLSPLHLNSQDPMRWHFR